jgi:hypothetical protein
MLMVLVVMLVVMMMVVMVMMIMMVLVILVVMMVVVVALLLRFLLFCHSCLPVLAQMFASVLPHVCHCDHLAYMARSLTTLGHQRHLPPNSDTLLLKSCILDYNSINI